MSQLFRFAIQLMRYRKAAARTLKSAARDFYYNELSRMAIEAGSDKGFPGHGYTRIYEHFFHDKREKITSLLEVGLLRHAIQNRLHRNIYDIAPSLVMWRKYFKNANIYGFDIRDFSDVEIEGCTIIQGDQSSRSDLVKIFDHAKNFDVIIDDALHASLHQQITLSFLFPSLNPDGLFFIEDLNYQPPTSDGTLLFPTTLSLLKNFMWTGIWNSPVATEDEKKYFEQNVKSIDFFDSLAGARKGKSDDLAVIKKG